MAKVQLQVFPPLSYKMAAKSAGGLTLELETNPGESLGELFSWLHGENPIAWRDLFDAQTGQMKPAILVSLNDELLSHSALWQTNLKNGDQVVLRIVYAGG